jgi:hypothetical protein
MKQQHLTFGDAQENPNRARTSVGVRRANAHSLLADVLLTAK